MKQKKSTKAGKERKDIIVQKVIVDENKTCLDMSIYSSALQVMRKYIKIFQQVEPAIFRIHTKQVDVFTEFLTNFIKPEVLSECNSIRKLKTIDFQLRIIYQIISFLLVQLLVRSKKIQGKMTRPGANF